MTAIETNIDKTDNGSGAGFRSLNITPKRVSTTMNETADDLDRQAGRDQ